MRESQELGCSELIKEAVKGAIELISLANLAGNLKQLHKKMEDQWKLLFPQVWMVALWHILKLYKGNLRRRVEHTEERGSTGGRQGLEPERGEREAGCRALVRDCFIHENGLHSPKEMK